MIGRKLKDAPGTVWKVIANDAGPNKNLYKLKAEDDGRETLASGHEIFRYYYPVH